MNQKPKGLGKGLSALMSEEYSQSESLQDSGSNSMARDTLSIDSLVSGKYQPRHKFTEQYLQELSDSIKKNGIMQPIVVRKSPDYPDKYEIIAGERRWRAARMAGLLEVPVIHRDINDQQALELSLVENIQRQDLTALEEAAGYQRLIDEFNYTQDALSKTVGKSRSHIANLLRLLSLPEEIKSYLTNDDITMGHARALLNAPNPIELVNEVIKRGLNVRQTENLSRTNPNKASKPKSKANKHITSSGDKDPDILALEQTLSENLGLNVSIDDQGQNGQIVISYDSLSQLDDILRRLGGAI